MSALLDFLYPAKCVVCEVPPAPLCLDCQLQAKPARIAEAPFPIDCAIDYSGAAEAVIRSFKDSKLVSLAPNLAELLDVAVSHAAPADYFVVPPRNRTNYRNRGFHPIRFIADRSQRLSRLEPLEIRATKEMADQRRLGKAERLENLSGAFEMGPASGRVLLVDDVLTTGATMAEMARAAQAAGLEVVGSCAIAYSSAFPVLTPAQKGVVCR